MILFLFTIGGIVLFFRNEFGAMKAVHNTQPNGFLGTPS